MMPPLDHLPDHREESSIPSVDGSNWRYPSQKQFFQSATKKGHELNPKDMRQVVGVHNAVNEETWYAVAK